MTALFAAGHVVNMATICEGCWLDSKRNGHCTEPACDRYQEQKR